MSFVPTMAAGSQQVPGVFPGMVSWDPFAMPVATEAAAPRAMLVAEQHRRMPMREPLAWSLLKHVLQLVLVASVGLFVVRGADAPFASLVLVGAALILAASMSIIDRERFLLRSGRFEVVGIVGDATAHDVVPVGLPQFGQALHEPIRLQVT